MCLPLLLLVVPPQAESINVKMTKRVNSSAVDLIFTLEGAARRALGVIYNLLPLDERTCSMVLINISWIAQHETLERIASFLSVTPPFQYQYASAGYSTLAYGNSRSVYVKYYTLFWFICQDI